MLEWDSGDIEVNGISVHYYRTGGNKPPVVLAHGATDDGLCWTRVAQNLESDYDVIMPDARGHGLSSAPEQGYSSLEQAADLAGLIQALGLRQPAVGGHSMGAGTTLRLVAEYPELVRCAFLEDPGFRMSDAGPGLSNPRNAIREVVITAKDEGRQAAIERGRAQSSTWDEAEFGPWADAKVRVSLNFLDGMRGGMGQEWRELLPRVRRPLLLITSDPERGSIVTAEAAEEARKLLPSLQVVHLSGAGHNIRREQFEPFTRCVREFLAAH